MSAELMQKAFEISASDKRLTPADKLVLIRWAWRSIDASKPYEIKFKTVARELGLSRNAVKSSVGRLIACGYLMPVAVKVVAGQAFQTREGGQRLTPRSEAKGGQRVTPGGSVSDPQRGQSVTPIKKKKEKRGAESEQSARAKRRCPPHEGGGGADALDKGEAARCAANAARRLSAFQRSMVRRGEALVIDGELWRDSEPRYSALSDALLGERSAAQTGASYEQAR